jgi:hypothetical protein
MAQEGVGVGKPTVHLHRALEKPAKKIQRINMVIKREKNSAFK